jgi:GntR family transcriptional regulator
VDPGPTIEFRLDRSSGVPAYRQLVDQVRQALQLGILRPGDQLPTVRDVVRQIAINPNTVHRSYRDLEQQGLIEGRPGSGTFVKRSLDAAPEERVGLQRDVAAWVRDARQAGLDDEGIAALVAEAMRTTEREGPP